MPAKSSTRMSAAWQARHRARALAYYHKNKEARAIYAKGPRGRYSDQMTRAAQRGVVWEFTFESWLAWWGADYEKRGVRGDNLCMARVGDAGPYSPANTFKTTMAENSQYAGEQRRTYPEKKYAAYKREWQRAKRAKLKQEQA